MLYIHIRRHKSERVYKPGRKGEWKTKKIIFLFWYWETDTMPILKDKNAYKKKLKEDKSSNVIDSVDCLNTRKVQVLEGM